jgi:hypothetical protein
MMKVKFLSIDFQYIAMGSGQGKWGNKRGLWGFNGELPWPPFQEIRFKLF